MCIDAMDTSRIVGRFSHRSCRRTAVLSKSGKARNNLMRNINRQRRWKADFVRATTRKYRMMCRKRGACGRPNRFAYCRGKARALPGVTPHAQVPPFGIMAPENTTQYLMCIVYDDLFSDRKDNVPADCSGDSDAYGGLCGRFYGDSLSPRSVYSYLDLAYESTLQFQQRDFETVFPLYSGSA